MFKVKESLLEKIRSAVKPLTPIAEGPSYMTVCGSCSGACKTNCSGTCRGSCSGGCTRSCRGHAR